MAKLNDDLVEKLRKRHAPSTLIAMRFRGKDLRFKTDAEGNAVTLFIGRLTPDGTIRGERYVRRLVRDAAGMVVKDHWDLKGKA